MFDQSEALPPLPGVGFKARHFAEAMEDPGPVAWFEVHAENYMDEGDARVALLRDLAARFPVSVHGIGLSIGGDAPLDAAHVARLRHLVDWLNPASFSEHLAWSTHEGAFAGDQLPLPLTEATLARVSDHVAQVQDALGRRMLLENPSSYVAFAESTIPEPAFLAEVARRTGCRLLLDVNNVVISATNLGHAPHGYVDAFDLAAVGEIHLGGHDAETDARGMPLLVDTHGAPVADPVWRLLDHVLDRAGPRPVLVEWDTDVPAWPVLAAEAARAQDALARAGA